MSVNGTLMLTALIAMTPLLVLEARGFHGGGMMGDGYHQGYNRGGYDRNYGGQGREDWQRNNLERNALNYGEAAEESESTPYYDEDDNYQDDADADYNQGVEQMEQGQQQPDNINININEDGGGSN